MIISIYNVNVLARRRNNYRDEEKEPEWFTGGPSSQTDTIELRGFDREGTCDGEGDAKPNQKTDNRKINTPSEDISSKGNYCVFGCWH